MKSGLDPQKTPEMVRPVVFLSGSVKDMGIQYGQQAKEYIARNAAVLKAEVLPMWKSWDKIVEVMDMYENIVNDKTPDIIEFWHGISEGSGVSYDEVRLINLSLQLFIMPLSESDEGKRLNSCSTMSCWGKATKEGKLIVGGNLDQGWNTSAYTVVIVAFPEKGNNFITTPAWAGEVVGNMAINDKGLALTGSGGQDAGKGDNVVGYPNFYARFDCILNCSNAEEAVERYLSLGCASAENAHFADSSNGILVEFTPAHHVVRRSGDFGECDYIAATNHFIAADMQSSLYEGEAAEEWFDAGIRYKTYMKHIEENYGNIDLDTVKKIMGTHDYWDGNEWHRDVYSMEPEADPRSCYSCEMRGPEWKTLMRGIAIPEEKTVHLINGTSDRRMATIPVAAGEYCTLNLLDSVEELLEAAIETAKEEIWKAGRDLNLESEVPPWADILFIKAKEELWKSFNYRAIAILDKETYDKNTNFASALTCVCKAQIMARMVQKK